MRERQRTSYVAAARAATSSHKQPQAATSSHKQPNSPHQRRVWHASQNDACGDADARAPCTRRRLRDGPVGASRARRLGILYWLRTPVGATVSATTTCAPVEVADLTRFCSCSPLGVVAAVAHIATAGCACRTFCGAVRAGDCVTGAAIACARAGNACLPGALEHGRSTCPLQPPRPPILLPVQAIGAHAAVVVCGSSSRGLGARSHFRASKD